MACLDGKWGDGHPWQLSKNFTQNKRQECGKGATSQQSACSEYKLGVSSSLGREDLAGKNPYHLLVLVYIFLKCVEQKAEDSFHVLR